MFFFEKTSYCQIKKDSLTFLTICDDKFSVSNVVEFSISNVVEIAIDNTVYEKIQTGPYKKRKGTNNKVVYLFLINMQELNKNKDGYYIYYCYHATLPYNNINESRRAQWEHQELAYIIAGEKIYIKFKIDHQYIPKLTYVKVILPFSIDD